MRLNDRLRKYTHLRLDSLTNYCDLCGCETKVPARELCRFCPDCFWIYKAGKTEFTSSRRRIKQEMFYVD